MELPESPSPPPKKMKSEELLPMKPKVAGPPMRQNTGVRLRGSVAMEPTPKATAAKATAIKAASPVAAPVVPSPTHTNTGTS